MVNGGGVLHVGEGVGPKYIFFCAQNCLKNILGEILGEGSIFEGGEACEAF